MLPSTIWAPAYTSIAVGSLVIFGGLLLLAAPFVPRAAGWARLVATVIAVLNALGLVVVLIQPAPAWYKLFGLATGLPALGILVLLYRADENAFFRRSRPARMPG